MSNNGWEIGKAPEGKQGQTIQDFLYFEGMFNPVARFAFTNVLDEDFVSAWNSVPYTVKPHQTVKLPHHLAHKFTNEIVNRMMQKENKGLMMAVPAARKSYEDKVLSLLPTESSSELEVIKQEFIEQVKRDASRVEGESDAQSPQAPMSLDFEDLNNRVVTATKEKRKK